MFKRIYRQRRRVLLAMVLFALILLVKGYNNPAWLGAVKSPDQAIDPRLLLTLICAISVVLVGVVVALASTVLAFLRHVFEVAFVTELVFSLAERFLPLPAQLDGVEPARYLVWISLFLLADWLLYRGGLDRVGLRCRMQSDKRFVVRATPQAVWNATATDQTTLDTFWTGTLVRVTPLDAPNRIEAHYRLASGVNIVQTQSRLIWEPPQHFLYEYQRDPGRSSSPAPSGTYEMTCKALGAGLSRVTITQTHTGLGVSEWLILTLDDWFGSEADAIRARIEGRRDWSLIGGTVDKAARSV